MKILLLGGTTEAVKVAKALSGLNSIIYSTLTKYGSDIIREQELENVKTIYGGMDKEQMEEFIKENAIELIVDATHVFAEKVSVNAIAASKSTQVPYVRYDEPFDVFDSTNHEAIDELLNKYQTKRDHYFDDEIEEATLLCEAYYDSQKEACESLKKKSGNILLTIGSKELDSWQDIDKDRLYVRVLPTVESITKCKELGYSPGHIIAQQGPFTLAENVAQIDRYNIKYLVTKATKESGGLGEKYDACLIRDTEFVLILPPFMNYPNRALGIEELKNFINKVRVSKPAKKIMLQGTGSSVGKSLLDAALCRILYEDGLEVAPFKSQNMALNSYITADGLEMGRAQVTQAECAGKLPQVEMNPVLLKPNSDDGSQVIVEGKVWKTQPAQDYYKNKSELMEKVLKSYQKLSDENDVIVIEGAGSPAEINLRDNDIVNMGLATRIDAPVILVVDIDKGGAFASLYGTVMLMNEEERDQLKGYIINKFRGDETLLWPGIEMLDTYFEDEGLDIPCLGIMPYIRLDIDDEDSVTNRLTDEEEGEPALKIGVIRLKHFSNTSDFTVFHAYDDIAVEYYDSYLKLKQASPDLLVIPGSKNTIDDMKALNESGMAELILEKAKDIPVIGICGGFQLMGKEIYDPYSIESRDSQIEGLGLLDITTEIEGEKETRQTQGVTDKGEIPIKGYQIHMGKTVLEEGVEPFAHFDDGSVDGAFSRDKRHFGTYLHGLFDNDEFRKDLLEKLGYKKEADFNYLNYKNSQYDKLAKCAREHLNMDKIYEILNES